MAAPVTRGLFQVDENGTVLASQANVDTLRGLWASRPDGLPVGPGVTGTGAWHVACHLAGAGCVRRSSEAHLLWLEISHVPANDTYAATLTHDRGGQAVTLRLNSAAARPLLHDSSLAGFVEGTSEGHITARGVQDPPGRFENWLRQEFDRPAGDSGRGGRVWEHWCTTRDLAPASELSASLLTAYVELCNAAGDLFAPTIARGRVSYGHPDQLAALIEAGFTTEASASWQTDPRLIGPDQELLLEEARAADALRAVQALEWPGDAPVYYMYGRSIDEWAG